MSEIELDITDEQLTEIIKGITCSFAEESRTYLEPNGKLDDQIKGLGQAVFNEFIIDSIKNYLKKPLK